MLNKIIGLQIEDTFLSVNTFPAENNTVIKSKTNRYIPRQTARSIFAIAQNVIADCQLWKWCLIFSHANAMLKRFVYEMHK